MNLHGILPTHLCRYAECCGNGIKCPYHHPYWAQKICIHYLNGKCSDFTCQRRHITWNILVDHNEHNPQSSIDMFSKKQFRPDKRPHQGRANSAFPRNRQQSFQPLQRVEEKKQKYQKQISTNIDVPNIQFSQEIINQQKKLSKELKGSLDVDVLLIMDCTFTMIKWMEQATNTLINVIDETEKRCVGKTLRVAFVGFTDLHHGSFGLRTIDFTTNLQQVKDFIKNIEPLYGKDICEDVAGGLKKGLELSFSKGMQCIYLIGDAPAHGKQYHNLPKSFDLYYDQVSDNYLEDIMKKYKAKLPNSYFTCFRLHEDTDKMYGIMKENFADLLILEAGDSSKFFELMTTTLKKINY